jgi:hypothetical protein
MTTYDPEDQAERRRVLRNDQRAREQGSTLMDHSHNDLAGGRFAQVGAQTVVGKTTPDPWPKMPKDNPWAHDPVPAECPFGVAVETVERRR